MKKMVDCKKMGLLYLPLIRGFGSFLKKEHKLVQGVKKKRSLGCATPAWREVANPRCGM